MRALSWITRTYRTARYGSGYTDAESEEVTRLLARFSQEWVKAMKEKPPQAGKTKGFIASWPPTVRMPNSLELAQMQRMVNFQLRASAGIVDHVCGAVKVSGSVLRAPLVPR